VKLSLTKETLIRCRWRLGVSFFMFKIMKSIKDLLESLEAYLMVFLLGLFIIAMIYGFFWIIGETIIKIIEACK
jgi:hypothetical protein